MKKLLLYIFPFLLYMVACKQDPEILPMNNHKPNGSDTIKVPDDWVYNPEPYNLKKPHFQFPPIPKFDNNPTTKQGVKLGRMLFYDPILSLDSTLACASCHRMETSFSDQGNAFSKGVGGKIGVRNAMALINLVWGEKFDWDGNANSLEDQALKPVVHPLEMQESWEHVAKKLERHPLYPKLFYEAFGKTTIDKELVTMAIAQFVRTLISGNSKFDRYLRGEGSLTRQEREGYTQIFLTEKGDCFHCHNGIFFSDLKFHNNGLDSASDITGFKDKGLGGVTGRPEDYGKFKVPTLRNIELTAPYMHDGRFKTLEEVIEFYNSGSKPSPNIDPNINRHIEAGGLHLTQEEKDALIAFLKTLTDTSFVNNPDYGNPFDK